MKKTPVNPLYKIVAKNVGCSREYVWQLLTGRVKSNSPKAKKIKKEVRRVKAVIG